MENDFEIEFSTISEDLFNEIELGDILYHADIPKYFSENFPNVKTQDELMNLRRQYLRGHFKTELEAGFGYSPSGIIQFVAKPSGYTIQPQATQNGVVQLLKIAYPNGCKVQTYNLASLGQDEDELVDNMRTIHKVECIQKTGVHDKWGKFVYYEGNIRPVSRKTEIEPAQRLIDELSPFKSLMYALHMGICEDTVNLMLPRFLTLFTFPLGLENNRPSVAQFTCPSTGKSTFVFKKTALLNAHYINEVPRLPALVGNCATNYYGYAKIFNILDFDEFEKYKACDWNAISQCFLTGMYNAVWKRDQSTKDGSIMQYRNEVSVNFHGNADLFQKSNARDALKLFLQERKDPSPTAFDERVTLVQIVRKCRPMQKMVLDGKSIKHPVFRGVIKLIQDDINTMKYQKFDGLSGRYEESWNKIYLFMCALFPKLSKDDLKICSKEMLLEGQSKTLIEIMFGKSDKKEIDEKVIEQKEPISKEIDELKKEILKKQSTQEEQVELMVEVDVIQDDCSDTIDVEEIDEITDTTYYSKENVKKRKSEVSAETLKIADNLKLKRKYRSGKLI